MPIKRSRRRWFQWGEVLLPTPVVLIVHLPRLLFTLFLFLVLLRIVLRLILILFRHETNLPSVLDVNISVAERGNFIQEK